MTPVVLNSDIYHAVADVDLVVATSQAADVHLVRVAAKAQLNPMADIGRQLRATPRGGGVEGSLDAILVRLGRLDGRLEQRYGMLHCSRLPGRRQPVEPLAVVAARAYFSPV